MSRDERLLGVGLESVAIHVTDFPGTIKATPVFGSGWATREDWGTWTVQTKAYLAIPIPPQFSGAQVQIDVALRGHVNPGNARVGCTVRNLNDQQTQPVLTAIEFQPGRKKQTASITVRTISSYVRLASKTFTLLAGRYYGEFCLYAPAPIRTAAEIRVIVRALSGQSIAQQVVRLNQGARGVISISLDFLIEAGPEDLHVEFESESVTALEGCQIDYLSLRANETQKPRLPTRICGIVLCCWRFTSPSFFLTLGHLHLAAKGSERAICRGSPMSPHCLMNSWRF